MTTNSAPDNAKNNIKWRFEAPTVIERAGKTPAVDFVARAEIDGIIEFSTPTGTEKWGKIPIEKTINATTSPAAVNVFITVTYAGNKYYGQLYNEKQKKFFVSPMNLPHDRQQEFIYSCREDEAINVFMREIESYARLV